MKRFVEGMNRFQATFLPESLDDFVGDDNSVRVVDVFVDGLDLRGLGFDRVDPKSTGRPSYHPSVLLKLYIYGYLHRVQSSRRLEREAGRNVEVMWLLGRLIPDHKTIADFRKDNGKAIRSVCSQFVELCRRIGLLSTASVAIDGSKFKAVNNRDRNFTKAKMARRMKQIEESVERYLNQLDSADRQEPTEAIKSRVTRLHEKIDNEIEPFAPRDCRRTFKTLAGSIGIDLELRNRLQGHAMTDLGSVHYDRWDYMPQKLEAIKIWTGWLSSLVDND